MYMTKKKKKTRNSKWYSLVLRKWVLKLLW